LVSGHEVVCFSNGISVFHGLAYSGEKPGACQHTLFIGHPTRLPHFRQIGKARIAGDPFVHAGKLAKIRLIARILNLLQRIAEHCVAVDDAAAARIFRAMSADSCILSPRAAASIFPPCPPS
jgi:hypothetical protein